MPRGQGLYDDENADDRKEQRAKTAAEHEDDQTPDATTADDTVEQPD